jgi:hypothetical protein
VQKIGPAGALKSEFRKVDAARKERARALEQKVTFICGNLIAFLMSSMMLFKFGGLSQITSGQQMSGLAAAFTFSLFVWSGRFGYRLFPVIRVKRTRDIIVGLVSVLLMLWSIVFMNLILPRHDFTMGPLIVAIYWGFITPAGVLIGLVLGIETTARKRGAMAVS